MGLLDGLGIYVRPYTYGYQNGQGNGWKGGAKSKTAEYISNI